MFRVIIAGGRDFNDYSLLQQHVDRWLSRVTDEVTIISGRAKGADTLGERYANERGYLTCVYPADWDSHGKAAGFIRNKEMAKNADALIAFWDGQSTGTRDMIELAKQYGLLWKVVYYNATENQEKRY